MHLLLCAGRQVLPFIPCFLVLVGTLCSATNRVYVSATGIVSGHLHATKYFLSDTEVYLVHNSYYLNLSMAVKVKAN